VFFETTILSAQKSFARSPEFLIVHFCRFIVCSKNSYFKIDIKEENSQIFLFMKSEINKQRSDFFLCDKESEKDKKQRFLQ